MALISPSSNLSDTLAAGVQDLPRAEPSVDRTPVPGVAAVQGRGLCTCDGGSAAQGERHRDWCELNHPDHPCYEHVCRFAPPPVVQPGVTDRQPLPPNGYNYGHNTRTRKCRHLTTTPSTVIAVDGSDRYHHSIMGAAFLGDTGSWSTLMVAKPKHLVKGRGSLHAELYAISEAVRLHPGDLTLLCDCTAAVTFVRRWQEGHSDNVPGYSGNSLYKLRSTLAERRCSLTIEWVRAHSMNPLNEGADALARLASRAAHPSRSRDVMTKEEFRRRAHGIAQAFAFSEEGTLMSQDYQTPGTQAVRPTIMDDLALVRAPHNFDMGDAPYQPEALAVARAAERLADEVERLRSELLAVQLRRLQVGPMRSHVLGCIGDGRITQVTNEGVNLVLGTNPRRPRGTVFIRDPEQLALIEQPMVDRD